MSKFSWLASYPKSGNTWFRIVSANLFLGEGQVADINDLKDAPIASARAPFDEMLLVDSALLSPRETDRLRPLVYRAFAQAKIAEHEDAAVPSGPFQTQARSHWLVKVHDAWVYTDQGEALLGGSKAAENAIYITRDPRDVALSLAHHRDLSVDMAIEYMADEKKCSAMSEKGPSNQLRQHILSWSLHAKSWLDQTEIPVHHIRYEDMESDPVATICAAHAFAGNNFTLEEVSRAVDLASFDRLKAQEAQNSFREAPAGRAFFRRGKSGGWRDELKADQIKRIEADHGTMMEQLGYPFAA